MTISKKAIYGSDRDQVMQDLASNIFTLEEFLVMVRHKLTSEAVHFNKLDRKERAFALGLLLAENAVKSMSTLVTAEIGGGYHYGAEGECAKEKGKKLQRFENTTHGVTWRDEEIAEDEAGR